MRLGRLACGLALVVFVLATSAAAGSLRFQASFDLRDRVDACPPEYPPATTVCRYVSSSTLVRGLGRVTITQRTISQPAARFRLDVSGSFAVAGMGEVSYSGDNGAYPGQNRVDFTFSGGTGRLAGATGGGTVTNSLTQSPTAFWEGTLVAPAVSFDLAAPDLRITRTTVARAGARLRVRIAYTMRDASPPVALRATVGRSTATARAAAAGTLTVLLPARPRGTRLTGRLTATDAVGNAATRSFSIRA